MSDEEQQPNEEEKGSAKETPKEEEKKSSGGNQAVLLRGEVKIFPGKRIPYFDKREIKAYEAETKSGARAFALVCQENLVSRNEIVHKYINATTPALPKLSASGVVDWTPEGREKYVFVFEDNLGKPLSARSPKPCLGIKPDVALNTVMHNVVDALSALHDRGVVHGNVRLQNIFDGGTATLENAMLGECLCAPVGYTQSGLYETIERSIANPLAKGDAIYSDDIYALGMCLAMMIAPHDFTEDMSDEEIRMYKLENGSFNLATSRHRFPGAIVEMLRGMLDDDPEMRWTIWEVKECLDGQRITGKQKTRGAPKSSRPIEFLKKKYFRPDTLAANLQKEPTSVMQMVEDGEFYLWLNRSLQSKPYEERYDMAVEQAKKNSSGSNYAERLTSYLSVAMAPSFPVFYRGMSFFPSGFGPLLADAVIGRKDLNPYVEVLQGDLVSFWAKCRMGAGLPVSDEVSDFETCRMYLLQKHIGFGLERCLYFLAPSIHCLSDKLVGYQVRSAADLLTVLEKLSTQKNRPSWFFDRHIVAFLYAHDKSAVESFAADLNATEKHRQVAGILKTFAKIQARDSMGPLPNLSAWIAEHLGDLVNRYHDRERRKAVLKEIGKLKSKGNLQALADLFNNYQDLQNDMKLFVQAMRQFQALRNEFHNLSIELETNKNFGLNSGHQTSTLVAGVIAALVVVIYLVFTVSVG